MVDSVIVIGQPPAMFGLLHRDVWERIFDYVRGSEVDGHREFFKLLTVSKHWNEIALPYLYYNISIRVKVPGATLDNPLRRLSFALITPSAEKPRRTWIHSLHLDIDNLDAHGAPLPFSPHSQEQIAADNTNVLALSNWTAIILMHTHLSNFRMTGDRVVSLHAGCLSALVVSSAQTLTRLKLFINEYTTESQALAIVMQLQSVRSLELCFTSFYLRPRIQPKLADSSPLIMPAVSKFVFDWRYDEITGHDSRFTENLAYLAACRFSRNCQFVLAFGAPISAEDISKLKPLFSRHHSDHVELRFSGEILSSVIFQNTKKLELAYMPHPQFFFDLPPDPPTLIVHVKVSDARAIDRLWRTLDELSNSTHTFHLYLQFIAEAKGQGQGGETQYLEWDQAPENLSHEDLLTTLKLMRCSQTLAPKGFILLDRQEMALEQRKIKAPSYWKGGPKAQ